MIVVKFIWQYLIDLQQFCVKRGPWLPGGWWAIAMDYIVSGIQTMCSTSIGLATHREWWTKELQALVLDFNETMSDSTKVWLANHYSECLLVHLGVLLIKAWKCYSTLICRSIFCYSKLKVINKVRSIIDTKASSCVWNMWFLTASPIASPRCAPGCVLKSFHRICSEKTLVCNPVVCVHPKEISDVAPLLLPPHISSFARLTRHHCNSREPNTCMIRSYVCVWTSFIFFRACVGHCISQPCSTSSLFSNRNYSCFQGLTPAVSGGWGYGRELL